MYHDETFKKVKKTIIGCSLGTDILIYICINILAIAAILMQLFKKKIKKNCDCLSPRSRNKIIKLVARKSYYLFSIL